MKLIVNWIVPIVCALYLSLAIAQHFTPTAFRYLFLGFLFFFIARLYVKTFLEKRKEASFNKKTLIAGIILSIVVVGAAGRFLVPEVIRINRVANITITALGKKNEKSQAYEVWLEGIKNNGSIDLSTLPLDSGWKQKDNNIYAGETFPATLHVTLDYVSKSASLIFLKHGWSGMVQVNNGKQQGIIDLYSDKKEDYKYQLDSKQAQVLNDSTAKHVAGYIIALLFYSIVFYFLLFKLQSKRPA